MSLQVATFVMATIAAVGSVIRIYQNSLHYRLAKKMLKHSKKKKR